MKRHHGQGREGLEPRSVITEVLPVDPDAPNPAVIERAAQVLREGGLVAFPTETVYGLGANALDAQAVKAIFAAKERPATNPLIVHVPGSSAAQQVTAEWPDRAARLAERFWPGPLTLVLPKRPGLPDPVTAGGPTVGVRVPAHPVARALLLAAGVPVAAPSANRSTRISPTRAQHVIADLNGRIDLILDAGPTPGGLESTVLDLTTKYPTLLRPGLVAPAEIEAVVGPVKRRATRRGVEAETPLPSPGMLARHYAPRAPLELSYHGWLRVQALLEQGERVGWLSLGVAEREGERRLREKGEAGLEAFQPEVLESVGLRQARRGAIVISMPQEPQAYSARLYDDLHALDLAGVTRIVVDRVPETEVWLAIRDRLQRAATSKDEG